MVLLVMKDLMNAINRQDPASITHFFLFNPNSEDDSGVNTASHALKYAIQYYPNNLAIIETTT